MAVSTTALAEGKLAFVLGIDAYANLPADAQLQRAVADAAAVGDALDKLGFAVTRVSGDSRVDKVYNEFERFTRSIQPGDTVVFYYAGHGISLNDGNYLVLADVPSLGANDERTAKRYSLSEREIKQTLNAAGARVAVVVLDACRNNPFKAHGTRALGVATRGLARIDATDGVYSLYSAREGQTALDRLSDTDTNRNSVFTRIFLKQLQTPGLSLNELGEAVRDEVAALARGVNFDQVPAVSNDLIGARSIYLAGRALAVIPSPTPASRPEVAQDEIAWSFVGSGSQKQIEAFLNRFPATAHRAEAEARLAELRGVTVAALPPAADESKRLVTGQTSDVAECDRLAALTIDDTRPAGLKGAEIHDIDGKAAAPVCRRALSADPGNPRVKMQLGLALLRSLDGLPKPDIEEGTALLQQAGVAGNKAAVFLNAFAFLEMSKDSSRNEQGLAMLRDIGEKDYVPAVIALGPMYEHGRGVPVDRVEALYWYQKALTLGDLKSKDTVTRLEKVVNRSECDRLVALRMDAGRPADVPAIELVDVRSEAFAFCKGALSDDPGNARTKMQLGVALLARGHFSTPDVKEAQALFEDAAGAGNQAANLLAGLLDADGDNHPNPARVAQGIERIKTAIKAGLLPAYTYLGSIYEKGRGIAKDEPEALFWYREGAKAGDPEAAKNAERLAKTMPPGAAAERAALSPASSLPASLPAGTKLVQNTDLNQKIFALAVSRDGRSMLSGGWNKTLDLWDLGSGKLVRSFSGHGDAVTGAAFLADGLVLSSSSDHTLKLWEMNTGREIRTFAGHTDSVSSFAMSPDNRTFASAGRDNTVKLWDVTLGVPRTLKGHTLDVTAVAFSPDGRFVVSGSDDETVKVWNVKSGKLLRTFKAPKKDFSPVIAVAWMSDDFILAAHTSRIVKQWDFGTGALTKTIVIGDDTEQSITAAAFSPDGGRVVVGGRSGSVKLWDLGTRAMITSFVGHVTDDDPKGVLGTNAVRALAFMPDGRTVVSGSADGSVKLWSDSEGALAMTFFARDRDWVTFAPDGRFVASRDLRKVLTLRRGDQNLDIDAVASNRREMLSKLVP